MRYQYQDEEIDTELGEIFVITRERAREIRQELEEDKKKTEEVERQ